MRRIVEVFTTLLIFHCSIFAQVSDSLKIQSSIHPSTIIRKKHQPRTAAIFSAILPGSGQIYNGKYWKAPIVWGGLAGFTYLWTNENSRYNSAKTSYLSLIDTDNTNDIPYNGSTNVEVVGNTKNSYRNQRDMYLLFGILFYSLNIIDATVDAHFMNFDVSDDLSMNMQFDLKNSVEAQAIPALTVNFNIKK